MSIYISPLFTIGFVIIRGLPMPFFDMDLGYTPMVAKEMKAGFQTVHGIMDAVSSLV